MSRPKGKSRLKRMRMFIEQAGLCHWCKGRMYMPPRGTHISTLRIELRRKVATFDHLYHAFHPDRPNHERTVVLACADCNEKRGRQECRELPAEWRRAIGKGQMKAAHVRERRRQECST